MKNIITISLVVFFSIFLSFAISSPNPSSGRYTTQTIYYDGLEYLVIGSSSTSQFYQVRCITLDKLQVEKLKAEIKTLK